MVNNQSFEVITYEILCADEPNEFESLEQADDVTIDTILECFSIKAMQDVELYAKCTNNTGQDQVF